MKLKIEIETETAAFKDDGEGYEAARILRVLASKIEDVESFRVETQSLRDQNGNAVGKFEVRA